MGWTLSLRDVGRRRILSVFSSRHHCRMVGWASRERHGWLMREMGQLWKVGLAGVATAPLAFLPCRYVGRRYPLASKVSRGSLGRGIVRRHWFFASVYRWDACDLSCQKMAKNNKGRLIFITIAEYANCKNFDLLPAQTLLNA